MTPYRRQHGVALLAAILLVALGTILAASIAFQSAMAARRSTASISFEESALVAQGAEALAAYFLRDDDPKKDSLSDSWASPLPPTEITEGVTLAAALEDLQGRFNLNSLITNDGKVDPQARDALRRLLEILELEPKWADQVADWIDPDANAGFDGLEDSGTTGQDPPYRTANTVITSASELLALPGFGRERYLKLAPYVTALPPGTKLNVCTASGELLDAMLEEGHREYSIDPKRLAEDRKKECRPLLNDYTAVFDASHRDPAERTAFAGRVDERSSYFRLSSLVSLGDREFTLYSLLKREAGSSGKSGKVRVIQRSFTPD